MEPTEVPYYYDYDETENSTMCDYSEWTPSYSVIPVLYMLIFILGLSGNGVVIFTLRSRGHMRGSLIAIWLLSGVLAAPTLVFRTTKYEASINRTSCAMDFSLLVTNKKQETLLIAGLSISSTALGFLLPFLAMMVCYGFIGCTVTRHFNTLRKEDQRKKRLLKIITTLVVVFAASWMPFHVVKSADALSYLNLFPDTCTFLRFLLVAHPYATCLAYINSCLNPFLYAFFDLRFRSQCLCLLNLKKSLHTSPASSLSSQKTEAQSLATKV
ncbi:apelin receptor B-like [Solea senegalensis]|uniref:Apelin receptor B-like n=1 Tax=Solea senegalensis TaxID=28829 RepID=A0AAV6S6A7_SOLSE|nr:apelin receptor B-like [Solea senegalensis]